MSGPVNGGRSEAALTNILGADFRRLDSYTADPKWALVKVHGSVNWAVQLRGLTQPANLGQYLLQLDNLTRTTREGVTGQFESLHLWDQKGMWDEKGSRYPAMVVPVQGKYEYMCPDGHLDAARELIKASRNYLVIGNSGLDDDLIDLLRENVRMTLTLGIVSYGDAKQVLEAFQQVPGFETAKIRTGNRGFSEFISSGQLSAFLAMLYDDDNRGPWSSGSKSIP